MSRGRLYIAARASLLTAAAFGLLLFPLVALRVDAVERTISWRWANLGWTTIGVFALSFAWRLRMCPDAAPANPLAEEAALSPGRAAAHRCSR